MLGLSEGAFDGDSDGVGLLVGVSEGSSPVSAHKLQVSGQFSTTSIILHLFSVLFLAAQAHL